MPTKKQPTGSEWTDPDDAPHLDAEWFAGADVYDGDRLVSKGGRPPAEHPKQQVTLRLDSDVLEHFRASGRGWQTRINEALRHAAHLDR